MKVHALRTLQYVTGDEIAMTKCGEHGIVTTTVGGVMRVQTSWEFIEVAQNDTSMVTCGMCLAKLKVPQ